MRQDLAEEEEWSIIRSVEVKKSPACNVNDKIKLFDYEKFTIENYYLIYESS